MDAYPWDASQRVKLEIAQQQRLQEERAVRDFKARRVPPAVMAAAAVASGAAPGGAQPAAPGPTNCISPHAGVSPPSRPAAGHILATSTASLESSPACRLYEPRGLRTPASLGPYLRSPHPECTFHPQTNFGRRMAAGCLAPR